MSPLLLALLAGVADIGVRAQGDCPSAQAVVGEARPLLPGRRVQLLATGEPSPPSSETVEIKSTPQGRAFALVGPNGALMHSAPLPPELGCDDAAREIAVWLAAWEFQGEAIPPRREEHPPTETGGAAPEAPPLPPSRAQISDLPVVASKAVTPSPPLPIFLGTGLIVDLVGTRPSTGILGELRLGPPEGVGLHVELAVLSEATVDLGIGRALWSRAWAGLGGSFATQSGRWVLDARGDLLAGFLSIAGDGFNENQRGSQLVLGAETGLRVALTVPSARFFLGPSLVIWPGRHTVTIAKPSLSRDLPSREVLLCLGVDFLVRR